MLDSSPRNIIQKIIVALDTELNAISVPADAYIIKPVIHSGGNYDGKGRQFSSNYGFRVFCNRTEYADKIKSVFKPLEELSKTPVRRFDSLPSPKKSAIAHSIMDDNGSFGFVAKRAEDLASVVNDHILSEENHIAVACKSR